MIKFLRQIFYMDDPYFDVEGGARIYIRRNGSWYVNVEEYCRTEGFRKSFDEMKNFSIREV